jgi:hypothetical protein
LFKLDGPVKDSIDIHAGAFETELMRENFPGLVDTKIAETHLLRQILAVNKSVSGLPGIRMINT